MPARDPRSPALDIQFTAAGDRDMAAAVLDDFAPLAIVEDQDGVDWVVHFRSPARRDAAAAALEERRDLGISRIATREVDDEGWARRSQSALTAVRVGSFVVAPPWDVPPGADAGAVIVIEPSTGFGTGHHQTTRLCLRLLETMPLEGARVVDIGTGSGVLAIAAARRGAREVVAVDCDPDALDNARDNVGRNGVDGRVRLIEADLATLSMDPADVVTANLTSGVLHAYADAVRRLLRPGGQLIASGFGPAETALVAAALRLPQAAAEREDDWVGVVFRG